MEKHKWVKNGIRICPTATYLDRRSSQARRRNSAEQSSLETQLGKLQAKKDEVVRNLNRTSYNIRNQQMNSNAFRASDPAISERNSPKLKRIPTPMPACISSKRYSKADIDREINTGTEFIKAIQHTEWRRHSEGDLQKSLYNFQAGFKSSKRGSCVGLLPAIDQEKPRATSAKITRKSSPTEIEETGRLNRLSRIFPCLSSSESTIDVGKNNALSSNDSSSEDELLNNYKSNDYSKSPPNPQPTPTPSILVSCEGEIIEAISNVNRGTPSPILVRRNGWSSTTDLSEDVDNTSSPPSERVYPPYIGASDKVLTEWRIQKPLREARKRVNTLTPASFAELSQRRRKSDGDGDINKGRKLLLNSMFDGERRKSENLQLQSKIDEFLKKSCAISN